VQCNDSYWDPVVVGIAAIRLRQLRALSEVVAVDGQGRTTDRQDTAAAAVPSSRARSSSARHAILRLPAGYRQANILSDTDHAALSLPEA